MAISCEDDDGGEGLCVANVGEVLIKCGKYVERANLRPETYLSQIYEAEDESGGSWRAGRRI